MQSKKKTPVHTFLLIAFKDAFENNKPLPDWLVKEGIKTKKLESQKIITLYLV